MADIWDIVEWGINHPQEMPVITNLAAIAGVIIGVVIGIVRMLIDYRDLIRSHIRYIGRVVKRVFRPFHSRRKFKNDEPCD